MGLTVPKPPPGFGGADILANSRPTGAAAKWTQHVVANNPAVAAVSAQLVSRFAASQPKDLAEMLTTARELASAALQDFTFADDGARASDVMATALVALAHVALCDTTARMTMAPFLPTGRPESFEVDAAWHFTTHCMFAFMCEHDRLRGDGTLRQAFMKFSANFNADGQAGDVRRAYEASQGALRPLHPDGYAGYFDVDHPGWFFATPSDLSPSQREAFDAAVCAGDSYEHLSSPRQDYDPALLRTTPPQVDPTAKIVPTHGSFSGLTDPSVCVDITANRTGAWVGTQLAANPAVIPDIPFDTPQVRAQRPLAAPQKVSFARYYAVESESLAKTGLLAGGAASVNRQDHEAWAAQVGPEAAMQELRRKLTVVSEGLYNSDRETFGRFYAAFAVRHLGWRVTIGPSGLQSPNYDGHQRWGQRMDRATMRQELEYRLRAMERHF